MPEISANSASDSTDKQPAHQAVYETLRRRILFGELAPGQPVTIQGIADELDAGMTPVREAIRRLTSDGALTMMGNRRVTVPELTANCIEQLVFMRKMLEPELAKRAAHHITEEIIATLDAEDRALNTAIEKGDIREYLTCNYRFHALIYSTADAPIMAAMADRMWLRFGPSLRVVCGRYGTMNLPDKHADLLAALRTGDAEAVRQAMLEDVEQGMRQIAEALTDIA